jgi:hypothetical protein
VLFTLTTIADGERALILHVQNMGYLCAEVFCLGWLFRSAFGRPDHGQHGDHIHHGYAPLPGTAAAPHQHTGAVPYNYPSTSFTPPPPQAPPVLHPQHGASSQPVHVVHVQPPAGYPPVPSTGGAPAAHAPIPHYPVIAPVYSPFAAGPPPQNVGWGVPVYGHSVYPPVPEAPPQVPPTYTATVGPSSSSIPAPAAAPRGKDPEAPSAPPAPPSS